jgi:hypothetical protein
VASEAVHKAGILPPLLSLLESCVHLNLSDSVSSNTAATNLEHLSYLATALANLTTNGNSMKIFKWTSRAACASITDYFVCLFVCLFVWSILQYLIA